MTNTFPESCTFQYDLEPKRLVEPTAKKVPSIIDQHLQEEDDFRLILKYMKNWKKYVKIEKLKRSQKEAFLKKMMKAIDFYERNLMKKGWKSIVDHQFNTGKLN